MPAIKKGYADVNGARLYYDDSGAPLDENDCILF